MSFDVTVKRRLNNNTSLEINFKDERDLKEAILKATPFMQIPLKCGKCGGTELSFGARNTKGGEFIYVEAYCFTCKARRPMGEYKSPKGALFFKQWEDPYEGNKREEKEVENFEGFEAV